MSFRVALSGLNAASNDLNVVANNVANANTTGFKSSRAEFADVYANFAGGLGSGQIGSGVRLANVSQQFGQGNIDFTDNTLDMAISGQGFFILSDGGTRVYSRAGAFGVDRDGYVVNNTNQRLQVYGATGGGNFNTGALTDLRLSSADSPPAATSEIEALVNIPANASAPAVAFDPADPDSFNHSTSLTVYDSLGAPHVANLYFVKTANPNEWQAHAYIDGTAVGGANTLQYSDTGQLTSPANGQITLPAYTPGTGAADMNVTLNFSESTQYGDRFGVNALRQDGFATGRLSGVEITEEGVVQARFTNGQATPLGMIALANFANDQGLQPVGDTAWAESFSSGPAIQGQAGASSFGVIQSGALEASNVELTEELVNMIIAQRNFQANSQVISTNDAVTQTIINIR